MVRMRCAGRSRNDDMVNRRVGGCIDVYSIRWVTTTLFVGIVVHQSTSVLHIKYALTCTSISYAYISDINTELRPYKTMQLHRQRCDILIFH